MDAKTLQKMTVPKLREAALKFGDVAGVHGMNKVQLVEILKQKYGIIEARTESEALAERRHQLKKKIHQLKAEKVRVLAENDPKKAALLRRRLQQHRHLLKKVVQKVNAQK